MKVDWKALSKSPGYIKFKQAMIASRERSFSTNVEIYAKFRWALGRAQHYAIYKKIPLDDVLLEWETTRRINWANFYQDGYIPKLGLGKRREPFKFRKSHKNAVSAKKDKWTLEYKNRAKFCLLYKADASTSALSEFRKRKKMD